MPDENPDTRRRRALVAAVAVVAVMGIAAIVVLVVPMWTEDDDDTLSTAAFCRQLEEQRELIEIIGNLETTQLEGSAAELDELAARAPEDIRAEMTTLADAVGQVIVALESVESGDVSGAEEALRPLQADLATAQEAGAAVETYARDRCGLDLRTGATVATTVPAATAPATTLPPSTGAPTTVR